MEIKALVITQFERYWQLYLLKHDLRADEYPYVHSTEQLLGYDDVKIILLEEPEQLHDWQDMEAMIEERGYEVERQQLFDT